MDIPAFIMRYRWGSKTGRRIQTFTIGPATFKMKKAMSMESQIAFLDFLEENTKNGSVNVWDVYNYLLNSELPFTMKSHYQRELSFWKNMRIFCSMKYNKLRVKTAKTQMWVGGLGIRVSKNFNQSDVNYIEANRPCTTRDFGKTFLYLKKNDYNPTFVFRLQLKEGKNLWKQYKAYSILKKWENGEELPPVQ